MKNNSFFLLPFFLLLAVLYSCADTRYISTNEMNRLRQDSTFESSLLNDKELEFSVEYKDLGNDVYKVYVFKKLEMTIPSGFIISFDNEIYDFFVATYKNRNLFYWGYLDDFKKNDAKILQTIGERVAEKLTEKK
jgi:hypothetical protein